ncbi:hypothetical protein K7432_008904 [Basidiobolus ranarum]|uniref:Uncharacterized protein n=1 Tax=Basidiobolus ranarum TaxID=34480 RepID=A0ABR2VXV6_9FUNG
MIFRAVSILFIISLADSIIAQYDDGYIENEYGGYSDVLDMINNHPNCAKCFGAYPCLKQIFTGGSWPESDLEPECACNEDVYAVFESDCLPCPITQINKITRNEIKNVSEYKMECAPLLSNTTLNPANSVKAGPGTVPVTSNDIVPTGTNSVTEPAKTSNLIDPASTSNIIDPARTSNVVEPTRSTNASTNKLVFSSGAVAITALIITLLV